MAATTIEKLAIELGLEVKDLKAGLKKAVSEIKKDTRGMKKDFRSVSGEINRMYTGLKKMATGLPAKLGLAGGIAGLGLFTKGMIASRMEMEDFETEWTVLMGSVEAARERLEELTHFAATTPFQLPDIIRAGKQMQNFGMYSKENLTLVGDAAAYSKQPIGELGMWFGRLYDALQSGRPAGEATMRLQELAIISGDTRNRIEAMQKAGKSGQEIWEAFAGSLGHLSGMMEKKSKTMGGMISNLRDLWYQFKIWVSEHVFQALKRDIDTVLQKINEWAASGKLKEWAGMVGEKIEGLYNLIKGVFEFLSKHWDVITSVATAVAAVVIGIEAWTAAQTVLNAVMTANPIGLIVTGIGLLIAAITYAVKKTVGWAAVFDVVKKSASTFWEFLKFLGGLIRDWVVNIAQGFKGFGKVVEGVFTLNFDKIKEGFEEIKAAPQGFLNAVIDRFSKASNNAVALWSKAQEEIEAKVVKAEVKGVTTTTLPPIPPPIIEVDSAVLKKIRDLQIKNTQDIYERRRQEAKAWYDDELVMAKGNAALEAEIKKQYQFKLEDIKNEELTKEKEISDKIRDLNIQNIQDEYERRRQKAEAWAADEITSAQGNAEMISAIREQLRIRLSDIDADEKAEMMQRQNEISDFLMNSFTQIGDDFAAMLTGQEVNWGQTWQRMIQFWIRSFFQNMLRGIARSVAAFIVGENVKRKEMMKTAVVAVASGAKQVGMALKSAAAAIYNAIANIAKKLSFLGPLAIPAVAAAGAALVALMLKFKKSLGLARGTRVKEPTAALLGEAGPEIVAPEKDFITYSRELIASIMGQLRDVIYEIQRPVIEAVETSNMIKEIRTVSMTSPQAALAVAEKISGGMDEESLIVLKQIRDNIRNLELTTESKIEGEDIYQLYELKAREHGRKEY